LGGRQGLVFLGDPGLVNVDLAHEIPLAQGVPRKGARLP
jgi:hypothetical protein